LEALLHAHGFVVSQKSFYESTNMCKVVPEDPDSKKTGGKLPTPGGCVISSSGLFDFDFDC
jgi:hypothetical protein